MKKAFIHGILWNLADHIFKESGLDIENYQTVDKQYHKIKHAFKKQFRGSVRKVYDKKFEEKISSFTEDSKLFLFSQVKPDCSFEKYLSVLTCFKNRQLMSKFRTSDHPLFIETGRYKNIPRDQRVCSTCKIVEDEYHFFLHCKANEQNRKDFIKIIKTHHPQYDHMSEKEKIQIILKIHKLDAVDSFMYLY